MVPLIVYVASRPSAAADVSSLRSEPLAVSVDSKLLPEPSSPKPDTWVSPSVTLMKVLALVWPPLAVGSLRPVERAERTSWPLLLTAAYTGSVLELLMSAATSSSVLPAAIVTVPVLPSLLIVSVSELVVSPSVRLTLNVRCAAVASWETVTSEVPMTAPAPWVEAAVTRELALELIDCSESNRDGQPSCSASSDTSWRSAWIELSCSLSLLTPCSSASRLSSGSSATSISASIS